MVGPGPLRAGSLQTRMTGNIDTGHGSLLNSVVLLARSNGTAVRRLALG